MRKVIGENVQLERKVQVKPRTIHVLNLIVVVVDKFSRGFLAHLSNFFTGTARYKTYHHIIIIINYYYYYHYYYYYYYY